MAVPWSNEGTVGTSFQSATALALFGTLSAVTQYVAFEFDGSSLSGWLNIATAEDFY